MEKFNQIELELLECNIDDMNPQIYPYVMKKLLDIGANDVWITPIIMKEGRPANTLSVLCNEVLTNEILEILFSETTSIGIRESTVKRFQLERENQKISIESGEVSMKISKDSAGKEYNRSLEFKDCQKLAEKTKLPLKTIYNKIK
ncbi:MAG: DUF111 family protein [Proteobacteria bacterium]|nr:DUF111 family protein [Pseudomonadota bacterium]